jgi:hypothetical protein
MIRSIPPQLGVAGVVAAALGLGLITVAARADSCINLKPKDGSTKIVVSQDESVITISITGSATVTGDTSTFVLSSDSGGVIWTAALTPGTMVSTSRVGETVEVCQSGRASSAPTQAPGADGQQARAGTTSKATPSSTQSKQATPAAAADKDSVPNVVPPATQQPSAKEAPVRAGAAASQASTTQAQQGANSPQQDPKDVVVESVKQALQAPGPADQQLKSAVEAFARDVTPFILYAASATIPRRILSDAEEKRIDQQVATTQPSTGTSVASKGSVPWLLGFAAESGALTQSTSNNVLTFNGTPANVVKALKAKNYLASYSVGADDPFVKWLLTPLSFSISFNVAQSPGSSSSSGSSMMSGSTGSTTTAASNGTFAGGTLRYSILNHRDARDPRYRKTWQDFALKGEPMRAAVIKLISALNNNPKTKDAYTKWREDNQKAISSVNVTPDQVGQMFEQRAEAFRKIIASDLTLQNVVDEAAQSIETYADARNALLNDIANSTAVAFEYTETQQKNLLGNPVTIMDSSPSASTAIPTLSTFNFIVEKGSSELGRSQFTANASTTIFNSIPAGTHITRVRDYRAAVQTDIPLPEIPNAGMPVLTFSGLFLSLLNQPLGQMVVVNDVPVSLRGNIWLFQSKLSLKIKDSGVKVPVSFTYANRTELNKESDKRGSIGVTYNLDNIFAKAGTQ